MVGEGYSLTITSSVSASLYTWWSPNVSLPVDSRCDKSSNRPHLRTRHQLKWMHWRIKGDGAPGMCPSSRSNFFHFSAVFDKNLVKIIGCWPKFRSWHPLRLRNPGSATGMRRDCMDLILVPCVTAGYKYIDS